MRGLYFHFAVAHENIVQYPAILYAKPFKNIYKIKINKYLMNALP